MTDTPRTDSVAQHGAQDDHEVVDADFARQLERELADVLLDRFQIETMRRVLVDYWQSAGHDPSMPNRLCDMALSTLNIETPAPQEDAERLNWMEHNLTIIRDIGWVQGMPLRPAIDAEREKP